MTAQDPGLDPQDWDDFRQVAHRLLDRCIDQMAAARDLPWQPVPETVRAGYRVRAAGEGEAAVANRLAAEMLPYGTGNTHPGFFGWVHGTGLASGLLSEMVAATINSNCGGRDHGMVYVERAVIDWARQVFGFPQGASGLLVSGTSQATVIAVAAARIRALGPGVRAKGAGPARLTAYAGGSIHNALKKALELAGIGHDNLRLVPETEAGMETGALARAIEADRAAGATPFLVAATAGSVDLGRFDDLNAVADVAARQGLWLHVDGAFGAWTRLADLRWRRLTDGIDRADSLACDFHKWMYVPYDCGLILIRDEAEHRAAFAARPSYLAPQSAGIGGGDPWFCDYGIDLSRGNRALKVWTALECYGAARLGAAITRNCELAALMGARVQAAPGMALAAPVLSNLCVFTAAAAEPASRQSEINTRIAQNLHLDGTAVFSTVAMGGVTCLRAAITNHRTREADIDRAVEGVIRSRAALA